MNPDKALNDVWHVTPINDIQRHIEKTDYDITKGIICLCKCSPTYEYPLGGGCVVIHNSFDGREGVEWANEIINPHV